MLMIRTWKKIGAGMILCFFMAGCGSQNEVYLETEVSQETGNPQEPEEPETGERLDAPEVFGGEQAEETDLPEVSSVEQAEAGAFVPETTEAMLQAERVSGKCYVYVCGEVAEPGVYVLESGDRIYEAVEMAGGMTADAGTCAVNLAQSVYDGLMVYIPDREEVAEMAGSMTLAGDGVVSAGGSMNPAGGSLNPAGGSGAKAGGGSAEGTASESGKDGRLNLNTASLAELMTLSGIGQTKAQAVVNYRDAHGGFSSVEEIMNVDGIKEGLYNRIRDQIKVK